METRPSWGIVVPAKPRWLKNRGHHPGKPRNPVVLRRFPLPARQEVLHALSQGSFSQIGQKPEAVLPGWIRAMFSEIFVQQESPKQVLPQQHHPGK